MSIARNIKQIVIDGGTIKHNINRDDSGNEIYWEKTDSINFSMEDIDKFYESYYGVFNTQYWDIRINRNSFENFQFKSTETYYITFTVKQNPYYAQSFDLYARDTMDLEDTSNYILIKSFIIPEGSGNIECEAVFNPSQQGLNSIDYNTLLFKVKRDSTYSVIMELENLKIIELNNYIKDKDVFAATFETLIGDCRLIINNSIFYVGADKILEIPEEMNIILSNINILDCTEQVESKEVVCLINYKY